jgi:hypothetical protein
LYYPKTIEKLNRIVAFTATRYKLDLYVNNFMDMLAGSSILNKSVLKMPSLIEYDNSISFHRQRHVGTERFISVKFKAYEAPALKWPDPGIVVSTGGTGGVKGGTGTGGVVVIWIGPGLSGIEGRKIVPVESLFDLGTRSGGTSVYIGEIEGLFDVSGKSATELTLTTGSDTKKIGVEAGWILLTDDEVIKGSITGQKGIEIPIVKLLSSGGTGIAPLKGGGISLYSPYSTVIIS